MGRCTSLQDKVPDDDVWKFCVNTGPEHRGIETSHGIALAGYSAERRAGLLCSTETNGSPICGAENEGLPFRCPNDDRPLQVAAARGTGSKQRPQKLETVLNGPRQVNVCEEMRVASSTILTNKEEAGAGHDPRPMIREETRKEAAKVVSKGRDPKVPVRPESRISRFSSSIGRRRAKRDLHVTIRHPPACSPDQSRCGCKGKDKCVFVHTGKASDDRKTTQW